MGRQSGGTEVIGWVVCEHGSCVLRVRTIWSSSRGAAWAASRRMVSGSGAHALWPDPEGPGEGVLTEKAIKLSW